MEPTSPDTTVILLVPRQLFHQCIQPTWLSSPIVSNIRKNNTAQTGDKGIRARASGYAMNTSPGPVSTEH